MHIFSITLLFALLCPTLLWANPTVFSTRLSNGLQVIIKEDHRSPMVMTQIWYGVGSIDEPPALAGISHLLEHMMFKGTVKVPNDEIKRINAEYGGQLNAFTGNSYTYYYQLYPSAYFALALELEADRMSNLLLKQNNLSTERQVVKQERLQRVEDRPQAFAFEQLKHDAFPTSRYAQPIIGFSESIAQIQLADIQKWYNTWYVPNNATLVIVGDVDTTSALLQVQRYFGDIPLKDLPITDKITEPLNQGHRHRNLAQDIQVENLYMAWNVPSLNTASNPKDAYSLMILKEILAGTISSRLQSKLVREQNILSAVSVSYDMIQRGDTLFSITAVPSLNVSLDDAQQAITQEISMLEHGLVSFEELERIRSNMWARYVFAQDALQGQAYHLGHTMVHHFDESTRSNLFTQYKRITALDIQAVLNTYFKSENLTTLYLRSTDTPLAPTDNSVMTPAVQHQITDKHKD